MEVKSNCPCENVSEGEKLQMIEEIIDDTKDKEGSLIQILHMVQAIYGYLPIGIQELIAKKTDIPLSKISGVVSFYSFFTTEQKGKHTINVCLGTACYVRGGKKIVDRLQELLDVQVGGTTKDRLFSLQVMRCIGACGLAPAISIDGKVYKQVNVDKITAILEQYD